MQSAQLPAQAQRIIEEEEALLCKCIAALQRAASPPESGGPRTAQSVEALRDLRDEVKDASDEDAVPLLQQMAVQQAVLARPQVSALPDVAAPYIAHLRLRDRGRSIDYLLGHSTFVNTQEGVRVIDWRTAPVAQIFYRYREGDDYEEEFPDRIATGMVEARRTVLIEKGVLTRIVTDQFVMQRRDEVWHATDRSAVSMSSGGAGTAARPHRGGGALDVTANLDAQQYAAVCAPEGEALLVLGSAGSGKTTVALHRLARLAAQSGRADALGRVQVVVPEEGLARLTQRLLTPLGASSSRVKTLDGWFIDMTQRTFNRELKLWFDAPASVSTLKRHAALFGALQRRLAGTKTNKSLAALRRRLADAMADPRFLQSVVDAAGGTLTRRAIAETVRHTRLQLAEVTDGPDDPEYGAGVDGLSLASGTPEELAGTYDIEDLPILLTMYSWIAPLPMAGHIGHLVLDEAEDFSLFDLSVLGRMLDRKRTATLAGDEAQQTLSSFVSWQQTARALGVRDATVCRLAMSYRCPRPITEFAQRILADMAPTESVQSARDGAPVGYFHFAEQSQAELFACDAARELWDRESQASIALVAHDHDDARRLHNLVAEATGARLVLEGEFTFSPGIDVTHLGCAKGLEWDYVIVPDISARTYPLTDDARRRLHVAATRASHQLWLISHGVVASQLVQSGGLVPATV